MLKVQKFETLSGTEYLQADIACKHDKTKEKVHWKERIKHFKSLDLNDPSIFKKASNPIGLRAGIIAHNDTVEQKPSGYLISLDASSSGLQLLSILSGCAKSWSLCGGDQDILDAYPEIYDNMHTSKELSRKVVKKAIMTSFYGSTSTPEKTFGEDIDVFYDTMEEMTPGAWDLNQGLQDLWDQVKGNTYDWVLPDGFYACIETSDKVNIPFKFLDKEYMLSQTIASRPAFHKGLGPNLIHSVDGMIVREMVRRCSYNRKHVEKVYNLCTGKLPSTEPKGKSIKKLQELLDLYKESGFLSARILDYIHADTIEIVDKDLIIELIESLPLISFDVLTVHDCFRCHPNNGNYLRKQYNHVLADINDSRMLEYLIQQIVPNMRVNRTSEIPREVILNGNYLLG